MQGMKRKRNIDIGTLRHHTIKLGTMEFCNGFGVRDGCHMCVDGFTSNGERCWICEAADAPLIEVAQH